MDNELAKVSSWYGPGPFIAWYMTALSVMLVWVTEADDEKDTLDIDFAGFLLYPIVAAGDSLVQSRNTRRIMNDVLHPIDQGQNLVSPADVSALRAAEAPYCVLQAGLGVFFLLMTISILKKTKLRLGLLVATYSFCLAVSIYVGRLVFGTLSLLGNRRLAKEDDSLLGRWQASSGLFSLGPVLLVLAQPLLLWLIREASYVARCLAFGSNVVILSLALIVEDKLLHLNHQPFDSFAPRTPCSLTDLDQMGTLITSILILLSKVWASKAWIQRRYEHIKHSNTGWFRSGAITLPMRQRKSDLRSMSYPASAWLYDLKPVISTSLPDPSEPKLV